MFEPSLQTHFNYQIDPAALLEVAGFGFRRARMDCQTCSVETMHAMIADADAAGLGPVPIVYDVGRLEALAGLGVPVEWGNEPDGDIRPSVYREQLNAACAVALERDIELWGPAISNLDVDSLLWLEAVRAGAWPVGLSRISVHRYGDGTFEFAHRGFSSRAAEVSALLVLCDGLPIAVTEFGYPTKPNRARASSRRAKRTRFLRADLHLSEAQAAANIGKEWEFWREFTDLPFLYQVNDGPNPDEGYGIRRFVDGALDGYKQAAYEVPKDGGRSMIAITNATLFGAFPITGWLTADVEGSAVKLSKALEGGPYLSIQPGGEYEGRPAPGGVYESFKKQGSDLVCSYVHDGIERVHVVPFKDLT